MSGSDAVDPDTGNDDWDALRLALLLEVARARVPDALADAWRDVTVALTDAFDAPAPPYAARRQLRTFALVRWPQLARALDGATEGDAAGAGPNGTSVSLPAALRETAAFLRMAADARERGETDALEREMALLRELLEADASPR